MELTNHFEVTVPVDEAWKVLTDVERIAPCLPGAQLKEVEGDEYRGIVKVKVGPITASYRGAAHFEELDEKAHRAVLKAEGRETRGQGNASATITATLNDTGSGRTAVSVVTELNITGKVAQFGRGVLADVSGKLLDQFVGNLETTVLSPGAAPEATPVPAPTPAPAAAATEPKAAPAAKAASEPKAKAGDEATTDTTEAGDPTQALSLDLDSTQVVDLATAEPVGDEGPEAEALVEPAAAETATASAAATESKPEPTPPTAAEAMAATEPPKIRQIDHPTPEPVNLMDMAGPSLAKRVLPYASIAGSIFLLRIVIYALRRRKK